MTINSYAFIKNNEVVSIALFDDPTEELLNHFKEANNIDLIILSNDKTMIGGTYDGTKFWIIKPQPSWIKNEELNEWVPPIPYPQDGGVYVWDESTTTWQPGVSGN